MLGCEDLIRMYEPELPPGIKKSSMMTPEIKDKAHIWLDNIYKGLDRYTTFLDVFVKDQVFLNLILYLCASTKRTVQYKVVLYCAQKRNKDDKK